MDKLSYFKKIHWCNAMAILLVGCASLPKGEVHYYLAKSDISFKVVRIATCDKENHLLFANAVTAVVSNSADPAAQQTIDLAKLKGPLSDADLKIDFYDDGRLKGINSSSTGEAQEIVKTAIGIAGTIVAMGMLEDKRYPRECAALKDLGKGKPVTFTFAGSVTTNSKETPLELAKIDKAKELDHIVGPVCVSAISTRPISKFTQSSEHSDQYHLAVHEPGMVTFKVTAGIGGSCGTGEIWTGDLLVARAGKAYSLPIPSPVLFGKEAMSASFSDAGALTSLQFTSTGGAGQALGVVSAGLTAHEGEAATKAAQLKAESDLIAQEQRLLQCKADPAGCQL